MRTLLEGIRRLSRGQKLALAAMVLLIACTWLAVCAILATYLPL